MMRFALAPLLVVGVVGTAHARPSGDDMHEVPEMPAAMQFQQDHAPRRGVTLYVNGDGGTVTGGWDDSTRNVSSIAWGIGADVDVPRWRGSARAWKKVVACVRERFSDFDVEVVGERPDGGQYQMIMVGGEPSMFGYPEQVGGVAPYTGEVLHGAIGFVFAAAFDNDVESTCVAILHEAGHTLGLDHLYLCEDPMSYLWGCGEKRWQDQAAYCGESEERSCGSGEDTQNSYRMLAAHVGLRDDKPQPEPEPEPEAEAEPEPEPDFGAPAISIETTDDEMDGNGWIEIAVRADSGAGVAEVELGWASETQEWLFACSSIDEDAPARCYQDGDVFHFYLYVGTGLRAMAARVTDTDGAQAVTDARVIYLR